MQGIGHSVMVWYHAQIGVWVGIVSFGNLPHGLLDHAFHSVGIKVTHNNHRLSLRAVPALIK